MEEPFKTKSISQRINSEKYDHTKTYCGYQSRVFAAVYSTNYPPVQIHVIPHRNVLSVMGVFQPGIQGVQSTKNSNVERNLSYVIINSYQITLELSRAM